MKLKGKYDVDRNLVLKKTYTLICLFFANKEISRRTDPQDESSSLKSLEMTFFESEASRLLLEIAIAVRVIDDQMKTLPKDDERRVSYETSKTEVNNYDYALFDDLNLGIRETCNKIIHSDVMEPHFTDGTEANEFDMEYKYTGENKSIDWQHFNGYVRLCGTNHGKEWYVLLDIEVFAQGVYDLLKQR